MSQFAGFERQNIIGVIELGGRDGRRVATGSACWRAFRRARLSVADDPQMLARHDGLLLLAFRSKRRTLPIAKGYGAFDDAIVGADVFGDGSVLDAVERFLTSV